MTASLTFAPSVLMFICSDDSFGDRMMYFGALLPGVSLLVMSVLGFFTLKETFRGFKAAKKLGKATNETEARELEEAEQKVAAQQQEEKSTFQFIKIFEVTGESMPQAILQTSIVLKTATGGLAGLWTFLVSEFNKNPWSSTIVVVLSSLLSLVLTGGGMMTESRFVINGCDVTPYHSLAFTMVNTILMLPVIIPRLIGYSLVIASLDGWIPTIPIIDSGLLYMILSSTIITKFKKQRNPKEFEDASGYISVSTVSTYLRLMAITSLFMPCMMVNSQWPLLNHLAITSGTIICLILSILMLISHQDQSLLS